MNPVLTSEQVASMTPEQTTYYQTLPDYIGPLIGRQILEWNSEQRRLRQIERKQQLQSGQITQQQFETMCGADPEPSV